MNIKFWSGNLKGRDLFEDFGVNWKIILTKILTKVLRGFPQSLQANTAILPRIDHDRFLPDPFESNFQIITLLLIFTLKSTHANLFSLFPLVFTDL
jgi:hypothetical protein